MVKCPECECENKELVHKAGYTTTGTLYYCENCGDHFEVDD